MRCDDKSWTDRAGPVLQYRLYFLDNSCRIDGTSYEFEAPGDATAISIAESWREGRRMELWCGSRRVQTWSVAD